MSETSVRIPGNRTASSSQGLGIELKMVWRSGFLRSRLGRSRSGVQRARVTFFCLDVSFVLVDSFQFYLFHACINIYIVTACFYGAIYFVN